MKESSVEIWQYLLDTLIILFFVLLNGFFVAAEFAIVKVRITQLEPLIIKKNLRAKIALSLVTNLDAYLSATQLGITMSSLALGWIGEPLVAEHFLPIFETLGIKSMELIHTLSFATAFSIITFLHIILGELAPKSLAIQKAKATTLWVAYPLKIFYSIFKPIIYLLNLSANIILKLFGFQNVTESELVHSEEELRLILSKENKFTSISKLIALNAMDFRLKHARNAMVPRKSIIALSIDAPIEENIDIMRKEKFSRFPVYKGNIDNIIGIIHTKDIFKHNKHLQPDFNLLSVLRDATFLPESVSLEVVLTTILERKTHMIILVDEFGGTAGLITLENVLEELVGNIQDEYDREVPDIIKINENEFIVTGDVTTNTVERLFNTELSPMDIRSIGGLLIEKLGHIPTGGEELTIDRLKFTIEKVSDNSIQTIRITKLPDLQDNLNG